MTTEILLRRIGMRSIPDTKHRFNPAQVKPAQILALVLACASLAAAQDAQPAAQNGPAATVQVNVKVVTMPVTVRDKHGAIVSNLTKDDFSLSEDGKPQTIKYFNHDTNLPLNLGLLVDTSMSQRNVLDDERTASQHFLDQMLTNSKDRAFVIQFDREVDLLEDLTSDKGKLRTAIDQIGAPQFQRTSSGDSSDQGQGQGRPHYGGGTMLYDAIYLAANEVMKQQKGRKAIVVLTDGVDRGSKETLNSAIEAAQRADTVVYALYYKGEENHNSGGGYPGGGRHGYPGGGYPGGGYREAVIREAVIREAAGAGSGHNRRNLT